MSNAFQNNPLAFQQNAFQLSYSVDAFQRCAFQFNGFQTSQCDEPVRSGVWRLQLYKLQEESLRKDKEKREVEIAKAVEKVVGPVKQKPAVVKKKAVVERRPVDKQPPVAIKPILRSEPSLSERTLPLALHVWSIMTETYWLSVSAYPIKDALLAKIEAANDDDEDIEMLLLAA